MAGAQFEYDERGGTFFYFVVSFYALVLIPATYYFWPRKHKKDVIKEPKRCHCDGCEIKRSRKKSKEPWHKLRKRFIQGLLLLGWVGFFVLVYKVAQIEVDHVEYDPYALLDIDRGATIEEIKKKYRKMSLLHHPDRGGDSKMFVAISKAYQALTDNESRENWEKYGNPDGPGATTFGIALPKWLVSKEYGIWVLAAYGLVFMVVLPVGVGIWWYNSIKYSVDQVLMDTTHLYGYMFHKTPNMVLRRALMILAGSFEFWKTYNKEIIERPSDDRDVPLLMKELPNLGEKNKERPLCLPYSLKGRAIIHAHLFRLQLSIDTLDKDRIYMLRKCPILVQEMVQVLSQLVMLAHAGRVQRMPSIDSIENVMRIMPMLVQALWENRSPLLQLPHFTEDMLRYCVTKKRRIKNCQDLASLDEAERRSLLRNISDSQYLDIKNVLSAMPKVVMDVRFEVQGEDDKHTITAGSLVTVYVKLTRKSLLDAAELSDSNSQIVEKDTLEDDGEDQENQIENNEVEVNETEIKSNQQKQRKPWEKQAKKKKGGKKGAGVGTKNKKKQPLPTQQPKKKAEIPSTENDSPSTKNVRKRQVKQDDNSDESQGSDAENSDYSGSESGDEVKDALDEQRRPDTDDEDMDFDDDLIKKDLVLETKSKITHTVHCPYFPEDKYEWWWVYMCDRKHRALLAGPQQVTTLVTEDEIELKFPAPDKRGTFSYQVCLRSDSFMDADITKDIKLNVEEAREVKSHPQWEFPSDEEDNKSESDHSDASDYTEGEEDDD